MFEDTSEVLFDQITDAPGEPDDIGMVIAALLSEESRDRADLRHPALDRDMPPAVRVKLCCSLIALILVRCRAGPSGRGCKSLPGVPCAGGVAAIGAPSSANTRT